MLVRRASVLCKCYGYFAQDEQLMPTDAIQIFVKLDTKTITLWVRPSDTVASVKEQIAGKSGIAVDDQVLLFRTTQLDGDHPLSVYNVQRETTLAVIERMRGGGSGVGKRPPSRRRQTP